MRDLFYTLTIFEQILVFSIFSILGIDYGGVESGSNVYYLTTAVIFCIDLFCLTTDPQRSTKLNLWGAFFLCSIVLFVTFAIVAGKINTTMFKCYAILCVPSILIAIHKGNNGRDLQWIGKWLDPIMTIIGIALCFSIPKLTGAILVGDAYYSQNLSYYASLCLSLDLFLLKYGSAIRDRAPFFQTGCYKAFQILLFPCLLGAVFISGGRGGFVVIAVSVLVFLITGRKRIKHLWRKVFLVFLAVTGSLLIVGKALNSDIMDIVARNTSRIFSYITASGIDMTETSGRDGVYKVTLNLIRQRPILGYGFFSYPDALKIQPYPHNLFLEWLLQGGGVYFIIAFTVLICALYKFRNMISRKQEFFLIMPIGIYALTELMFSASYMQFAAFWFFVVYVCCFKVPTKRRDE